MLQLFGICILVYLFNCRYILVWCSLYFIIPVCFIDIYTNIHTHKKNPKNRTMNQRDWNHLAATIWTQIFTDRKIVLTLILHVFTQKSHIEHLSMQLHNSLLAPSITDVTGERILHLVSVELLETCQQGVARARTGATYR